MNDHRPDGESATQFVDQLRLLQPSTDTLPTENVFWQAGYEAGIRELSTTSSAQIRSALPTWFSVFAAGILLGLSMLTLGYQVGQSKVQHSKVQHSKVQHSDLQSTVGTLDSGMPRSGSRQDVRESPSRSKLLTSSATSVIASTVLHFDRSRTRKPPSPSTWTAFQDISSMLSHSTTDAETWLRSDPWHRTQSNQFKHSNDTQSVMAAGDLDQIVHHSLGSR